MAKVIDGTPAWTKKPGVLSAPFPDVQPPFSGVYEYGPCRFGWDECIPAGINDAGEITGGLVRICGGIVCCDPRLPMHCADQKRIPIPPAKSIFTTPILDEVKE